MKAATEKEGIHSASVHLDTILKGLNLLSHSGQHKTVACAKGIWVGASAIIVGKVKSDRMPSWHQKSYLSFDVLSTAMIPGNWRISSATQDALATYSARNFDRRVHAKYKF
jgi:hypothetical protein